MMGRDLLTDALGRAIRFSGTASFRGKGRLIAHWLARRPRSGQALRTLPGGARVQCDLAFDYDCMVYLRQEEEVDLLMLRRMLRPGDIFVDGGANIGIWTLVAAPAVGAGGSVIAFEPNPATAARLRSNVSERNAYGAVVTVIERALGSAAGTAALSLGASHNVSRLQAGGEGAVNVQVTTIDSALASRRVAGIKLDVEGSEWEALQGASRTLAARPWLCVEFNTLLAGTQVLGRWPVDEMLRDLGYAPSLFRDGPEAPRLAPEWTTTGYVNLLYRHRDAHR